RVRQNNLPGTVGLNLGKKTKKEPNGVLRVSVISFEGCNPLVFFGHAAFTEVLIYATAVFTT
ncbi:MAG TPA: hypothetical protein PK677_17470, partial [Acidiphilium sp.]|nr:hypothetical protein [Acidiphilium sp.]